MMEFFGLCRVVADPVLKEVGANQTAVVNFSVVCNEHRKVNGEKVEQAHFFDCEAWDTGAKLLHQHVKKGQQIVLRGRLKQDRWESEEGKRSKVVLRVDKFDFVDRVKPSSDYVAPKEEPAATEDVEETPF